MTNIMPNTTPIPHIIIREWMPLLKDIELRVLLVVTDQTLGWIEDYETKRRKDRDWISHYQLRLRIKHKGGKIGGGRAVTAAIANLVDNLAIIQAMDEEGKLLDSPEKRMKNGAKIFYRLNLRPPQRTLFDLTPAKRERVVFPTPAQTDPRKKGKLQKKPILQKKVLILVDGEPSTDELIKKPSNHKLFVDYWYDLVKATRNIQPVITKADASNLKRIIDLGIDMNRLEQCAMFFLADYSFKTFSPSISTFTSSGVLNGLLNRVKNDRDFWKKLNSYTEMYCRNKPLPLERKESDRELVPEITSISSTISKMIEMLNKKVINN